MLMPGLGRADKVGRHGQNDSDDSYQPKEPQAMKRFIGLLVATIAVGLPLSAVAASASTSPSDYRPECENFYNQGKAVIDPLVNSPLKAVFGPMEKGVCGDQKHVPQ